MINSRAKGAQAERELAQELVKEGYKARRGQQFSGVNGDADVVGLDGYHIECKRCETYRIDEWLTQAERDAQVRKEVPLVIFRKSRQPWRVIISLKDFLKLLKGKESDENSRFIHDSTSDADKE